MSVRKSRILIGCLTTAGTFSFLRHISWQILCGSVWPANIYMIDLPFPKFFLRHIFLQSSVFLFRLYKLFKVGLILLYECWLFNVVSCGLLGWFCSHLLVISFVIISWSSALSCSESGKVCLCCFRNGIITKNLWRHVLFCVLCVDKDR